MRKRRASYEERRDATRREQEKEEASASIIRADLSTQLYGIVPVLESLRAGSRSIERILIGDGVRHSRLNELITLAREAKIPIRRTSRDELDRIAPNRTHQGVVAIVSAAKYADTDALLDSLSSRIGTTDPPLAVILDGVEDPRNFGAIIRTAECVGVDAIFIPERRASGLTETVAKASAGAIEYVPIARATNLTRLVDEMKERNIWTVGVEADADREYTAWDWRQPTALVFGGEGQGLHRLVREHCDVVVKIPLRGRISSLNVSVAAGIVLYEALRQRTIIKD
jgi:23S rRNA (guanosine2251-2'-O)-methyltransferase